MSWFIYHPGIVFPRISLQPLCSGLVNDMRERVFESFTRATTFSPKYSCEQVQISNGVGYDVPKIVTPQRETKNKKTNSDNDSNLRCSFEDDLNDNNTNLLPSNATDHHSDLSYLCPAKNINTELLTPSHEVWICRLPFGGNHAAIVLLRERNKSPSLTIPNNNVQVP